MMTAMPSTPDQDTITIIAASTEAAMLAAHERGLEALGYVIAGRVVPHQFTLAGEQALTDMFEGATMVAATWIRNGASSPQRAAG